MIKYLLFIYLGVNFISNAQDFYLDNQWQSLGPNTTPGYFRKMSSLGIGPTEFIKATPHQKGLLLTGSIPGGLFYSTNGGDLWINAGSDEWDYSSTSYADFYPSNANTWFAISCYENKKNRPSPLNIKGGIYRTTDKANAWKKIGNAQDFGKYNTIYSFKFNPQSPSKMYVLSSNGMYYTHNCLAETVKWEKESQVKGMVYDMTFVGNVGFITVKSGKKWQLYQLSNNKYTLVTAFETYTDGLLHLTLNAFGNQLLILADYSKSADKLLVYDLNTDKVTELSRSQRVIFGHGFTFGVSPHNKNEIYVGSGLVLRRWNFETKKFENLGGKYHVDVEFVSFDPFDENIIYMSNHGGISISYNKGKTWHAKNEGLAVSEVLGLAVSDTDPNIIIIGTNHDGSDVYANWDNNGNYYWKNVNGGDALIPLIDPKDSSIIYTSNQYTGGGIYFSDNFAETNQNIHSLNGLATSGWEMAATLHPIATNILFFNYKNSKGNIDVVRTKDATKRKNAEIISNFEETHQLKTYKVYSLFNSKYHPDILLAYVLHYDKDKNGKKIIKHRLYRTLNALDSAKNVILSWHEIELPRNYWLGDVVIDRKNFNKMYFSYISGKKPSFENPDESGIIYYAKYRKNNYQIKRNFDISLNIPQDKVGRYNLIYFSPSKHKRYVIIGTRSGVYLGNKFNLKGGGNWKKIGYGLPHCLVYGMHYNEKDMILTVGLRGRGVWRISLKNEL